MTQYRSENEEKWYLAVMEESEGPLLSPDNDGEVLRFRAKKAGVARRAWRSSGREGSCEEEGEVEMTR